MRKYIEYLPDEVKKYLEFNLIGAGTDKEMGILSLNINRMLDNTFILSLDDYGCTRWEHMLHLIKRSTDTLEDRRMRILAKFMNQLPYTEIKLIEMLDAICGKGNYYLKVDPHDERVTVKLDLGVRNQFVAVFEMLEGVVPLNLLLTVELLYNRHMDLKPYTHAELSKYTHEGCKTEKLRKGGII